MRQPFRARVQGALFILLLLGFSLPAIGAAAGEPVAGDRVRVRTADLAVEGTLVAKDPAGWRIHVDGGDLVVPFEYVMSVETLAPAAVVGATPAELPPLPVLPPVPVAPVKPALPASRLPAGPRLRKPSIPWSTYWPAMSGVALTGGPGGERRTAIAAKGESFAAGFAASGEASLRYVALGADLALDRTHTTLVRARGQGCLRDDPGVCYSFPDGLDHDTQTLLGSVYLKPHLILGRTRLWVRAGADLARVEYSYSHGGAESYGHGDDLASGFSMGGGFDWASSTRRFVLSASVLAGSPAYREDARVFGRPWRSEAGPSSSPVRVALGVSWVLPKGARQ